MSGGPSSVGVSPALLAPPITRLDNPPKPMIPTADQARLLARAKEAGQKFESQFLSVMLQQMYAGVKTDGPFGGGAGEEMFRSLMTEEMGKQMTRSGGIGLADTIQREILKLQGLT